MRSIIDILDLSVEELDELVAKAQDIMANPKQYAHKCEGKKLATMFYEPSTRTRLSFEAAMYELGGNVLSVASAASSSAAKGESVADTARMISCYADILAMRHPKEGAPLVASMNATIPVVNAGDGGHNHPTQTLADLLTIHCEKGRFTDLTIGLCGDLKFGRTVHSLIAAMCRYTGVKFVLIAPEELKLPRLCQDPAYPAQRPRVRRDHRPGGRHAPAGRPLHDPGAEGAVLQRGGLPPLEGQLHPHAGTNSRPPSRTSSSCIRCPASTRSAWPWTRTPEPATSSRPSTASSCGKP